MPIRQNNKKNSRNSSEKRCLNKKLVQKICKKLGYKSTETFGVGGNPKQVAGLGRAEFAHSGRQLTLPAKEGAELCDSKDDDLFVVRFVLGGL